MTGRDAEREQLMTALVPATIVDGSPVWRPPGELADALLPVVDRIATERAAAALEAAAEEVPGLVPATPRWLRARAAGLRADGTTT